ncbi:MAG: amidohydrolase [Dehalococcoidia bacterium]|nr:amidohydrolase [Dehalococcoidia bacterium]
MKSKADKIFFNASVITMDPLLPEAGCVVIGGQHIVAVGGNDLRDVYCSDVTEEIDCGGLTLLPGFNDAHCHLIGMANTMLNLDCTPGKVQCIDDIKKLVLTASINTRSGEWIIGEGYDEFSLLEKRHPNRWDLDEVSQNHPVKLNHRSRHACVLNGRALELAGINFETPDPPGGLIDREPGTGEPTGLLYEMSHYLKLKGIPPGKPERLTAGIKLAGEKLLSFGITSIQDATVSNDMEQWELFQDIKGRDVIQSRISLMMGVKALPDLKKLGMEPRHGDDGLRLGAIKVVLDKTTGRLFPSKEELGEMVTAAHRAGYQVAVHAIEEEDISAAASVFQDVLNQYPREGHRHRIEHCSICPDYLIGKLTALGIGVVTNPVFLYCNGDRYLSDVPAEKIPLLYRFKSINESGIPVAAGSDSPVAPSEPVLGIYGAVTRCTKSGRNIFPEECISIRDALEMCTTRPAYNSFEEVYKGSLSPGKLGDMVLLSRNPLTTDKEELKDIKVVRTIIGGKTVWEK